MTATPNQIARIDGVTADVFAAELHPRGLPFAMNGLVANWQAVRQAATSPQQAAAYLRGLDSGLPTTVLEANPAVGGRFAYGPDMYDFNFNRQQKTLTAGLNQLLSLLDHPRPPAIYIQSTPTATHLPRFAQDNPNPLLPPTISPRVWIGNVTRAQTHNDYEDNIACVAAGTRRFTLFPPEQVKNLYIGPFDHTPSGRPISLASIEEPDFERFPKLREALDSAIVADLGPGDAIFIPKYWWHHVQAQSTFNILVNYWWGTPSEPLEHPGFCFNDAILAIKDLPPHEKDYWKTMFDLFIFQTEGDPVTHIPSRHRGGLGKPTPASRASLLRELQKSLSGGKF